MKNLRLLLLLFFPFIASCEDVKERNLKTIRQKTKTAKVAKPEKKLVLNSMFAGSWYPKDKEKLEQELRGYLKKVKEKKIDQVEELTAIKDVTEN